MNKDEKDALDARHKEDEALQKKLAAKLKEDSDRYDKAVGSKAKEPAEPKSGTEGKAKPEEGK